VVPLAGQYFVYFHRICRYFFVAREVQTREVPLVVCDDLRARGSLNVAPGWGSCFAILHTAWHCHSLLLKALWLCVVSSALHHLHCTRMVSRTLTMTFTGTKIHSRPLPTVPLTTRSQKVPPAMFLEPTASFIPICPHPRIPSLDLTRYKSDRTEIRSTRPHGTSQPDATLICGIRDVFIRWNKVCGSPSPISILSN
jgi:hypothetical protein